MTPALRDLRPLPWQAEALHDILTGNGQLFAWDGGVGSGKSLTICVAAIMLAQTRPGTEWVLGMDTHPRLESVHLPLLRALQPAATWKEKSNTWVFRNGSELRLKHLEISGHPMGRSPIEGGNLSGVLIDECQIVDERYFGVADARARIPFKLGDIEAPPVVVLSGLPIGRWWVRRVRALGGRTWTPKTADNLVHLDPGYVARLRASLTEREQRTLLDGEELQAEGQALYAYSSKDYADGGNVLRGHPIDYRHMRTMLALDLGYRSPAALLFVEVMRGVWCITREWAPDRTTLPDLCEVLARDTCPRRDWAPGDRRAPIDELVVDPAGDAMNAQTGHPDLDLLARQQPSGMGLYPIIETEQDRRSVAGGVTRLNLALEKRLLLVSGKLVDAGQSAPEDHRTLIRAIQGYAWDPRNPAKPKKDGKWDHHIDAMRYGQRRVLWDALPPDPLEGRRPSMVTPPVPLAGIAAASER